MKNIKKIVKDQVTHLWAEHKVFTITVGILLVVAIIT